MDIKTLNEKLEQFFEEAAMVASNHPTFEDFYNYCLKNPKLKQKLYFSYLNDTIRIPSDTINHAWKKHKTTCEQWIDALNNIKNIQNVNLSKDKVLGRPCYLCRVLGFADFGIALADCPQYFYVMTLFKDHKNSIDNWIKMGSIRRLTSHPSASDTSKSSSVAHDGIEPNNIITYIKQKIKY